MADMMADMKVMQWCRSALLLGAVLSLGVLGASHDAAAQSFDHLKCYPIRDPEQRQWLRTDIVPLDAVFVDESGTQVDALLAKGCRVLLPASELCVAVNASDSSETPQPTPGPRPREPPPRRRAMPPTRAAWRLRPDAA